MGCLGHEPVADKAKQLVNQVAAPHFLQRGLQGGHVLFLVPEEVGSLTLLFFGVVRTIAGLQGVGMQAAVVNFGRYRHGRWGEILHLFELEIEALGLGGQLGHGLFGTAWVGRDEIRDDLLPQAILFINVVEHGLEFVEELERWLAHDFQHLVVGVFGGDFQSA